LEYSAIFSRHRQIHSFWPQEVPGSHLLQRVEVGQFKGEGGQILQVAVLEYSQKNIPFTFVYGDLQVLKAGLLSTQRKGKGQLL
jgi:hypothetical protein